MIRVNMLHCKVKEARLKVRRYLLGLLVVSYNEADSGHWFGICTILGFRIATIWDNASNGFCLKFDQFRFSFGDNMGWGIDLGQDIGGRYKRLDLGRVSIIYRRRGGASF